MRVRALFLIVCIALITLSACGPWRLRVPRASGGVAFSGVETVYSPEIPADRLRLLDRLGIPGAMSEALRLAYPAGPGPHLRLVITQFRAGRYGPGRLHGVAEVLDGSGAVVGQAECDATTIRGNRRAKVRILAQACVDQIASQL